MNKLEEQIEQAEVKHYMSAPLFTASSFNEGAKFVKSLDIPIKFAEYIIKTSFPEPKTIDEIYDNWIENIYGR